MVKATIKEKDSGSHQPSTSGTIIITTPQIKKRNRNSKPSQRKKQNRNSKISQINKTNKKTKPSAIKVCRSKLEKLDDNHSPLGSKSDSWNFQLPTEENLECSEIHEFLNLRYFSTILQQWFSCACCSSLYCESQLKIASGKHELYHDVLKGELLCRKCFAFAPSNNYPHCPYARYKNKFEISVIPEDLILGFIEQRAITLNHIYMSIILIRGRQAALKGQIVHFHVDTDVIVGKLLPFPRYYEFLAVVQEKPHKNNEIRTTVTYSFNPARVLIALI
ncbi:unnamed protein product [Rotaria socialis]